MTATALVSIVDDDESVARIAAWPAQGVRIPQCNRSIGGRVPRIWTRLKRRGVWCWTSPWRECPDPSCARADAAQSADPDRVHHRQWKTRASARG